MPFVDYYWLLQLVAYGAFQAASYWGLAAVRSLAWLARRRRRASDTLPAVKTPPTNRGPRAFLYAVLALLAVLRVDLWLWDEPARVLGLPAGMTYHVVYCLAAAGVMWLLVRHAWPRHLKAAAGRPGDRAGGAG